MSKVRNKFAHNIILTANRKATIYVLIRRLVIDFIFFAKRKLLHMKKIIAFSGALVLSLASCIKHEVIPPPVPMVDLYSHFIGDFTTGAGTATIELTENVLGYTNKSEKAKVILPPPSFSSAVYYSEMSSTQAATMIKIGLGSVFWDAASEADPSQTTFNNFFVNNDLPDYSNNANNGFAVIYRDGYGNVWESEQNSVHVQDVEFTNIVQESDSTGDYSLFKCEFNCWVYRTYYDAFLDIDVTDSVRITDAIYSGWFRR
jgi:hypothetical protein